MFGSPIEEKARAINDFLKEYYFNIIDSGRRVPEKVKNLYKYQVVFNGGSTVKEITSYSRLHAILAVLVLDSPQLEDEHPYVTYLRETVKKILEFENDDCSNVFIFPGYDKRYLSYQKPILKFLLSSVKSTTKLDLDSIKEEAEGFNYSIGKKVEGRKKDNLKKFSEQVIIKRTFITS